MKSNCFTICCLIITGIIISFNVYSQPRESVNLNDQWKFKLGSFSGVQNPGFDDSSWGTITLPHTWNNLDGQDGNGYKRETGWYRKKLNIPATYQGRRLFLRFGAANLVSTVYINGNEVGVHRGGYAAFIFDITSKVIFNASNTIAVKVDNSNRDSIAPLSADFTFCGGITRSVQLIVTDPITISLTDYASPGIYITPKDVSEISAGVSVKVLINNYSATTHSIYKTINIKDSRNNIVVTNTELISLAANSRTEPVKSFTINKPVLWNGKINPYLYKVEVILKENNIIKDSLSQPFGLRYYQVKADSGFYLNGKRYPLYGVNLHEDKIDKGRAISNTDRQEDMNILNELGVNFIRLSHYQHDQYTYDLADKNGIVLWTEVPLINSIANTTVFSNNIKEQLKELIRQNYNHPSVIFWGLYNEILQKAGPDPLPLTKELNTLAHLEDATRLTTVASNKDNQAVNLIADLVSFNKYYGWYSSNTQGFTDWLAAIKTKPLSLPAGLSEYGAGASTKHHELYPVMPNNSTDWHPEELQNIFHEQYWKSIKKYPFLWQTSAWVAFDFSSDGRNEGDRPGINDKGLVTQDRMIKKDAFFFYKSQWSKNPFVYITSRRYSERTDEMTYVKVYSNCDSVKLFVNNYSYGGKKATDNVFLWNDIILEPGVNIIRTKAYSKNATYTDSCIWRFDAIKAEKTIRINFQTNTTTTPTNYLADIGAVYAPKGNGLTYGWHLDNTANARLKNLWPDKLYDTYNHFQKTSPANYWEIALKNGSYLVQLVSGDPVLFDSNFKIMAENKLILNGIPSKEKPWLTHYDTVMVKDGRLTIRAANDAINSKINFIHITRVDSTNLGLGKKVSQSSTLYGGNPGRAIDGNTNGSWVNGSVIHTKNELNSWWEMDLGDSYQISTIQVWNRIDACCKAYLSNYYVFVSNQPFLSKQLTTTLNQSGVWNTLKSSFPNPSTTIAVNRTGRYIRIQLAGTATLNMAEVVVMGALKLPPAAPSALKALYAAPAINLSWNDNSNNEIGFTIERKVANTVFELIARVTPNTKTYIDQTSLKPGITYTYRTKTYNNDGSSNYSNEASITVPGGSVIQNLALHKPSTQSSTLYGGVPERAVDGNTDGFWANGSVTHTASNLNAWWEVNLGAVYSISNIEVWNRVASCCMARLSNYYVFVSDQPFQSKQLNTTLNQVGVWYVFKSAYPNPSDIHNVGRTGRYVRVQLAGTAELNLAEVIVNGSVSQLKSLDANIDLPAENELLNIEVYPVPFKDILMINSNQELSQIELYNILGEKIISLVCKEVTAELQTHILKPGFYIVKVKSADNQVKVFHVVKN